MRFSAFIFLLLPLALKVHANELETLTVTGKRLPASKQSLATNTAVVDEQALKTISHVHINEALARVPGAWISRGNGQEHLTAIRSPVLTGAGACGAFLIAEDGIPLRAPGFCNANQLFEVNSEQAQRIEVLRGPGSALYGSNAEHGIINIITPDPAADGQTAFALEGGPHDYWRARIKHSQQFGAHGFLLYGNGAHDGGYKRESGFDQQKINLVHRYAGKDLAIKSVLSATNLNQETAGFIEGRNAYKDSSRKRENPNPEAFRDAQAVRFYSRATLQLNANDTLSLTPYLRYTDMAFLQHFLPWRPLEENGQKSVGLQALYTRERGAWRSSIGLDIDYTESFLKETQDQPFSPTIPAGPHYDYDVDAGVIAPFIETEWSMSEATSLSLGLRFEHTNYDYDNALRAGSACADDVTGCRFSRPADRDDSYDEWAPRLGLLHHWSEQHASYAQLARGYRAPQATELYRLQAGQLRSDIDAEQLDSIELGFRGAIDKVFYDIALFGMRKNNFIFQDTERQNISNGETEHYGVEFDVRFNLPANFDLALNGTFARHRYTNSIDLRPANIKDNDIDTAPRHIGAAQFGWSSARGHRAELEWVHMGSYYQNPENSVRYPGHDLVNARFTYNVNKRWQLAVRVNNLTDKDYAERADFAFGDDRYFVGEPRSVYVSVNAEFGP
ncbi:MAG: TonB-dependent receptor [Pseudomonadales bacterium]